MDTVLSYLPSGEQGLMPYYLFLVGIVSVGNSLQNLATLHYTRRIYNGLFVPSHQKGNDDSIHKLIVASTTGKDTEKAQDQVTPLAARLFGTWTMLAGFVRMYAAHDIGNRALYQLALLTHVVAAVHFISELTVYKTLRLTGPQLFPLIAGTGGSIWMALQYSHYVSA
ncbi:ergosterol biosynthetic protein 28 [Sporothrix schenckii 1099-18]|uniref:Ergosterol biosynthetic protein 28 n=1 Tax=Sporothrix schenckii 1099-18 TaxID=1397361 RepID=A0A0F2LWZ9_SPOSC|nr:ergosterol biosynthetic protein 28 [Sporothrix schenckii 1099-18]KJR81978.1 ergosterol biosynthetic protein 28 [Sporothrix schenckii 1099-18]